MEPNIDNPLVRDIITDTREWNYFTALRKIKKLKTSPDYNNLNVSELSILLVLHSFSVSDTNNYAELDSLNKELDHLLGIPNLNKTERFWLLTVKLIHSTISDFQVDDEIIYECESFISTIDLDSLINTDNLTITMIYAYNLYYKARVLVKKDKWDEAYNAIKTALDLAISKANNDFSAFNCYNFLVSFYIWRDNLNKILETLQNQIDFFKSRNNHKYIIHSYTRLAVIYLEKSNDLRKSLEITEIAIKECSLIEDNSEGNLSAICFALTTKANILTKMGKYIESIQIFNQILPYATKKSNFDNGNALALWNINISKAYEEIGDYSRALEKLGIAFEILSKSEYQSIAMLPQTYYQLISVYLNLKKLDDAEKMLHEFTEIINHLKKEKYIDNKAYFSFMRDIQAYFNVAQAIIFLTKKTMIANSKAQILLQDVITDPQTKKELLIRALILLIDLGIQEYKLFEKPEIVEDITLKSRNLQSLTEGFNSIPLKIQVLVLQAKLGIITENLSQYEDSMNTAKQFANEYDLLEQKQLLEAESFNFNKEIRKWENIISTPLKDRLIRTELEDYIKTMSQIVNK